MSREVKSEAGDTGTETTTVVDYNTQNKVIVVFSVVQILNMFILSGKYDWSSIFYEAVREIAHFSAYYP